MRAVSQYEYELLEILQVIMGRGSVDSIIHLLVKESPVPRCFSRDAIEQAQEMLAKGCVSWLSHRAWGEDRFVRQEAVRTGRLWERTELAARQLSFTKLTWRWLIWLRSCNYSQRAKMPGKSKQPDSRVNTLGDRLFEIMMFEVLVETLAGPVLMQHPHFQNEGLLWLLHPQHFATQKTPYTGTFEHWFQHDNEWVLEAYQERLAANWVQEHLLQRERAQHVETLQTLGEIQEAVLTDFLQSIDRAKRRDLARFLLRAGGRILDPTRAPQEWFTKLNVDHLRMADRAAVYRKGLAFPRMLRKLLPWQEEAIDVTFYDDNYASSQLWKADWESLQGPQLMQRARELEQHYDALHIA